MMGVIFFHWILRGCLHVRIHDNDEQCLDLFGMVMLDLVWMVVESLEVLRWLGGELMEKTEGPSFEKEMVEVENPEEIVERFCNVVNCSRDACG
jgi:hypothetical protein